MNRRRTGGSNVTKRISANRRLFRSMDFGFDGVASSSNRSSIVVSDGVRSIFPLVPVTFMFLTLSGLSRLSYLAHQTPCSGVRPLFGRWTTLVYTFGQRHISALGRCRVRLHAVPAASRRDLIDDYLLYVSITLTLNIELLLQQSDASRPAVYRRLLLLNVSAAFSPLWF